MHASSGLKVHQSDADNMPTIYTMLHPNTYSCLHAYHVGLHPVLVIYTSTFLIVNNMHVCCPDEVIHSADKFVLNNCCLQYVSAFFLSKQSQ